MAQSDGMTGPPRTPSAGRMTPPQFADEFQASFRLLWLVARGIVSDPAAAEDIVQEAALVALEKLDQFQPGTSFTAWMAQMVRFVALNENRRHHRRSHAPLESVDGDQATLAAPHASDHASARLGPRGELPVEQSMFDDRVLAALQGVQDIARACLLLRTVEGLDYREIAQLLEIPEGTAMSHVHRARHYLRDRLADHDAVVPARTGGIA